MIKLFFFQLNAPTCRGIYSNWHLLNFLAFLVVLQAYGRKISKTLGGQDAAGKSL